MKLLKVFSLAHPRTEKNLLSAIGLRHTLCISLVCCVTNLVTRGSTQLGGQHIFCISNTKTLYFETILTDQSNVCYNFWSQTMVNSQNLLTIEQSYSEINYEGVREPLKLY